MFHQSGIMKTKKDKNQDYCSMPTSIYMLGLVLFAVSSFQYFNNTALRRFTLKTLQNKIIVITTFKDATILRFSREGFNMKIGIDRGIKNFLLLDKPKSKSIPRTHFTQQVSCPPLPNANPLQPQAKGKFLTFSKFFQFLTGN